MNIVKTTILAITAAASLGVFALSSATPASATYYRYGWAPKYWNYGYTSYRAYRPYCKIRFDYYGNPYKVCF
jgi:hypothetical protein